MNDSLNEFKSEEANLMAKKFNRRNFIRYAGASTGVVALMATGCSDDNDTPSNGVYLGSGDTAILNYAYALEQLEAAFYTTVVAHSTFSSTFSAEEQIILTDLRDHEIIHREFFKTALGDGAIQELEVDFSTVDFGNRESVLETAKAFEDLGVSAYNGAGKLLTDVNLLLVAGKIVSVEARHAAAIRDLLNPKSADFAGDDVVDASGLDLARTPQEVLGAAAPFIKTKINGRSLPTV